jgi:hypothetical protein
MARMNFLIVLETGILTIPLGILKNVEFHDGLMSVFCAIDIDRDYLGNPSLQHQFISHTCKRVRQKVRQSAVDTDL